MYELTGGPWRSQFDGLRWSIYGGQSVPSHGGVRVIQLEQTTRSARATETGIQEDWTIHKDTIEAFHRAFYASNQTHGLTFFEGVPVLKNPLDLWVAQEIIWDLRPTLIIETGTAYGGSALYYARQFDRIGEGHVLTIDLEPADTLPHHQRITYVKGFSSVHADLLEKVAAVAHGHPRVMVVLDSDHSKNHVLQELHAYAPMVTPGQFLIVEDTNINGRPVMTDWRNVPGSGPGPAVDAWHPQHPEFDEPLMARRYLCTFHTWLRRILL